MATHILETGGNVCPFPLIEAREAISQIPVGDDLVINFDCTQATTAIPSWAAEAGHDVTDFRKVGKASWSITVRKSA